MNNFPFVHDDSIKFPEYHTKEIARANKERQETIFNKDDFNEMLERAEALIVDRFTWLLNGSWNYGNSFMAWQLINAKEWGKLTKLYLSLEFRTPENKINIKTYKDFTKWVELVEKESESYIVQMWTEYNNYEATKKENN